MGNRLLSEREVLQALKLTYKDDIDQMFLIGHCMLSNAAQLTKTDKEWVEWIERTIQCPDTYWCANNCNTYCLTKDCKWWQERKKEIGIESTT